MANVIDLAMVYKFLRTLTMPYEQWPAFKSGVIDKDGNIIVKKNKRDNKQSKSFLRFDLMVLKLKQLLGKVPGGKSKLASYAAALWLIREESSQRDIEGLSEEQILDEFFTQVSLISEEGIEEDAAVNAVGGGAIAGVGIGPQGEPGRKRKKRDSSDPLLMAMRRHKAR